MNRYIKNIALAAMAITLSLTACNLEAPVDPNQPTLPEGGITDAQIPQLNNLVTGILSNMRSQMPLYIDGVGVIGREFYRFAGSDPRYVGDLLGANGSPLDNNAFYTTNTYTARYATIKNTNILIDAINNTNRIDASQKEGYLAFAKTMKAHELLLALNQQYQNGVRVSTNDPMNLGPFLTYEASLAEIAKLLDEGVGHLNNAGDEFTFNLSAGFADFNTPETFKQFNRAIAARVAIYRRNHADALTYLAESFMNLTGNYDKGAYHVFSPSSGDQLNGLYLAQNATGDIRLAHPSFVADAEAGDKRLSKVSLRTAPASSSGLTSNYDVYVYKSNTDRIPIIRNEELVLIYAEANILAGNYEIAATALSNIRQFHGLSAYTGPLDEASLINEMLKQRRYSLFFEGHRWIDMRRYNRLNELPIDRPGDIVHTQFPRPFTELGVNGG